MSLRRIVVIVTLTSGTFLATSTQSQATPTQWPLSSGGNGHSYEAFSVPNGISWTDARDAAVAKGGYLATITSPDENALVFSIANGPQYWNGAPHYWGPWLGGFQPAGSVDRTTR